MVHREIKAVSDQRLLRRGSGVYYYRRRVPLSLVGKIGRKVVQVSLHTTSLKEAKRRRTLRDLEWDARFDVVGAAEEETCLGEGPSVPSTPMAESELLQLVRDYVERRDQAAQKRERSCYPANADETTEMRIEAEVEAQMLRARDDVPTLQWIDQASEEVLTPLGKALYGPEMPTDAFFEWVRRGLLELNKRHQARLADDHGRSYFDQLFAPDRPAKVTFGELSEQWLRLTEEEAAINALSLKGIDRQRATLGLNLPLSEVFDRRQQDLQTAANSRTAFGRRFLQTAAESGDRRL